MTNQKTKRFPYEQLNWIVILTEGKYDRTVLKIFRLLGPYCKDVECYGELEISIEGLKGICPLCKKEYSFRMNIDQLRILTHKAFQAVLDKKLEFIPIDSLIRPLISEDRDEQHWVRAKFGFTSDGRKVVNVLIGDKSIGDKVHAFIDIDKESLRFDWKDLRPNDVVARLEAEFLNTKHIIKKDYLLKIILRTLTSKFIIL